MTIALPADSKNWTLWSGSKAASTARELADVVKGRTDTVIGVPASFATTFAVTLPTSDRTLIPAMIETQIDKRGLEPEVWDYQIVGSTEEGGTLVTVDVLSDEFPDELALAKAAGYAPSARLIKMPQNRIFLWKEQKRLVFAVNRDGTVTHVQSLGSEPELGSASAQELMLSALSLQGEGLIGDTPEVTVAGEIGGDRTAFETMIGFPVEYQSKLVPVAKPDIRDAFLPRLVRESRGRSDSRRKRGIAVFAVAAAYLIGGAFLYVHALRTKREIAKLEAEVAVNRPIVAEIQESEGQWTALEPAFDLAYFPVVQLNEITKLMPPSGVVLREYETKGRRIQLDGQAKDVQLAFGMLEALKDSEFFDAYEWSMNQPKVEGNNTASFRILGNSLAESAAEGGGS